MSLAKISDALSWRVYLSRQLEYALWCEHWEAESGVGSIPTGSVGPGRSQLHWGSVCPDDGKSFRSTFLGKRNLSTKSLRIVVQQTFQGTHRGVPIVWTGTGEESHGQPRRPWSWVVEESVRDPSCRFREKRKCSHKISQLLLTRREQREANGKSTQARQGATAVDTLQGHSSSVTPWDAEKEHPIDSHLTTLLIKSYLFIYFWLCWVFVAVWAFSLVVVGEFLLQWLLLWSTSSRACGVQQLCGKGSIVVAQNTGSVMVVHRLSCSEATGIFPDQGWNPCLLHQQVDSLSLSHQGSPVSTLLKNSSLL